VVGDDGRSLLTHAIEGKRDETVRVILEAGADVQPSTPGGWAPLHRAAGLGLTGVVELLLGAGADPRSTGLGRGARPRSCMLSEPDISTRQRPCVRLAPSSRPSTRGGLGAMVHAAYARERQAVEFLIAAGLAPDPIGGPGVTPLTVAARLGHENVVKALLAAGADANAIGVGDAPLQAAVAGAHATITRLLLEADASPAAGGSAALLTAVQYGWYDDRYSQPRSKRTDTMAPIIALLLEAGADPRRPERGRRQDSPTVGPAASKSLGRRVDTSGDQPPSASEIGRIALRTSRVRSQRLNPWRP